MDKASWQRIIANDYALPSQPSLAQLTNQLLSYLGSTNAELRESIAYPILEQWIDRVYYTHERTSFCHSWRTRYDISGCGVRK